MRCLLRYNEWHVTFMILCMWSPVMGAGKEKATGLLPDGLLLRAVDGKVKPAAREGQWLFELDMCIQAGRVQIPQDVCIGLLPSSALEALLIQAKDRSAYDYRLLHVRVAQYQGVNYFFASHFLPLSKKDPENKKPGDPNCVSDANQIDTVVDSNSADDPLDIPPDVKEKIQKHRSVQVQPDTDAVHITPNRLILDRLGYLTYQKDQPLFVLDGWGQTCEPEVFYVLPGAMLERIEQVQAAAVDHSRFRIVGVVSVFQGRLYLFLHRAVRMYPYGNLK